MIFGSKVTSIIKFSYVILVNNNEKCMYLTAAFKALDFIMEYLRHVTTYLYLEKFHNAKLTFFIQRITLSIFVVL